MSRAGSPPCYVGCAEPTPVRCLKSSKLPWWDCALVTDWMIACIGSLWRSPLSLTCPCGQGDRSRSIFSVDILFARRQDKMCGLPTLHWLPHSMPADKSRRKWPHSSPQLNGLCSSERREGQEDSISIGCFLFVCLLLLLLFFFFVFFLGGAASRSGVLHYRRVDSVRVN